MSRAVTLDPSNGPPPVPPAWIGKAAGCRLLGVTIKSFNAIVADGRIAVRDLPGYARFSRADIEKLARDCVIPPSA